MCARVFAREHEPGALLQAYFQQGQVLSLVKVVRVFRSMFVSRKVSTCADTTCNEWISEEMLATALQDDTNKSHSIWLVCSQHCQPILWLDIPSHNAQLLNRVGPRMRAHVWYEVVDYWGCHHSERSEQFFPWEAFCQDAAQLGSFCSAAAAEPGFWASAATTSLCAEASAR